jgi:glucose/arabinose dehydrogenase
MQRGGRKAAIIGVLTFAAALALGGSARAAAPQVAEIMEPGVGAAPLNPEDVHMEAAYADADGDQHLCTDWEIRSVSPPEPVWQAHCVLGQEKAHIHLGDGSFVNSHAGRSSLLYSSPYELRVRFRDDSGVADEEWSQVATRGFSTREAGPAGNVTQSWQARPGFVTEVFAAGLQLPVNVAMVPNPGPHPADPLMYVTELYGTVKVITRDGTVRDFASGLLDFNPTGAFPGSGEQGLTGVAVEPASGDLFVSLLYEDESSPGLPKPHYPRVVRLHADEEGLAATGQTTVLDLAGEVQGASHQISHLELLPTGELIVHNGDGSRPDTARDLSSFRGKILRMTPLGEPLPDNPFFDSSDGVSAEDYILASGLRNPFGGGFRASDSGYYVVENGPFTDRLLRLVPGTDYRWEGDNAAMSFGAGYNWMPSHAPVNISFVEASRFGGSGFPPDLMGRAYVTESGPTWASGPQELGKRIVEFDLGPDGGVRSGPSPLTEYVGAGKATAVGLAPGPDGLYFTDLYRDTGYSSPIDRGAQILRVRFCGERCPKDGPSQAVPGADVIAPDVSRFRLQHRRFSVNGLRRRRARPARLKVGTTFLYSLSETATVRIRVGRAALGWRRAGSCRRRLARRARKGSGRCILPPSRFSRPLRAPGRAGPNRRPFSGKLGRRPLRSGLYVAAIVAVDAAGNRSSRRTTRFRVLERRRGQ